MEAKNLPTPLRKYAAIISDVSDERDNDDGYWVYLKSGLINTLHEVHMVHEDDPESCAQVLKSFIVRCECSDCKEDQK